MMRKLIAIAVIVASGCSARPEVPPSSDGTEAAATPTAAASVVKRPPGVPDDYVLSHFGWLHPSCSIHVGSDEMLNGHGDIVHRTDGAVVRHVDPCRYPRYAASPRRPMAKPSLPTPDFYGHWLYLAQFSYQTNHQVTWLSSEYSVPNRPLENEADLAFWSGVAYDNYLSNDHEIIQPVLDYGPPNWRWQVRAEEFYNGNGVYTDYYPVNPGDTIDAYMYRENVTDLCRGSAGQWNMGINVNGTWVLSFDTCQYHNVLSNVWGGVFEINGTVSDCGGLPWNHGYGGSETFRDISIIVDNGNGTTSSFNVPNWDVESSMGLSPDCEPYVSAYGSSGTMWWDDI